MSASGTSVHIFPDAECRDDDSILLYLGRELLLREDRFLWGRAELTAAGLTNFNCLLLERGSRRTLAVIVTEEQRQLLNANAVSTREILMRTGMENFSVIGQGMQLTNWYLTHRFCGACGSGTMPHPVQRALVCPRCAACYYPRINPCVIVLVNRGAEVLLARSSRPGAVFFSCLAGFMEVGETPEETVAREVREEVGIELENIRYVQSQSWPFPSQLMLGFFADYKSGEVDPDPDELAEAYWFPIDNIPVPTAPALSVAGKLLTIYRNAFQNHEERKSWSI
jgi:NAD+ diphosphatase